jgi:ribose transport system ATP-binding protein
MHEFEEIVDRITVLRDGRNVGTVDWKDVTLDELIAMMVGRQLDAWRAARDHSTEETILQIENISSGNAVDQAGFTLKKGEIIGFAGLVGSGRTELMKSIFGARKIDSGTIIWKGKPARFRTPKDAVKQGIGYLSEDRKGEGLILHMGIDKNISLANLKAVSNLFFINKSQERKEAASRIESLRIVTDTHDKVVGHLSGGNQQKVVIAKWLLTDSEVLIFDEPTRGIDVGARAEIYQVMEQLAASGKGIIVVSSDLPEIMRISNRIIVMREGKIAGQLQNDGNVKQDHIMSLMVGG